MPPTESAAGAEAGTGGFNAFKDGMSLHSLAEFIGCFTESPAALLKLVVGTYGVPQAWVQNVMKRLIKVMSNSLESI